MKFRMDITLGNDAMQSGFDIAAELELIAAHLKWMMKPITEPIMCQSIRDRNGNRVGTWSIKES